MDNREGALFSIITNTNDRFACYAKKVNINLTKSLYGCLTCLPSFSINRLHKKSYFFWLLKYHDTYQLVITLSLLLIALYVTMIQQRICWVNYLKVFFDRNISMDFVSIT